MRWFWCGVSVDGRTVDRGVAVARLGSSLALCACGIQGGTSSDCPSDSKDARFDDPVCVDFRAKCCAITDPNDELLKFPSCVWARENWCAAGADAGVDGSTPGS